MRRIFVILGLFLLVAATSIVVLVNVASQDAPQLLAPDPLLPIALRDGTTLPLAEVLDRLRRDAPLPGNEAPPAVPTYDPILPTAQPAQPALTPAQRDEVEDIVIASFYGPTFAMASREEARGHYDQAIALYQSVREDEPGHAYAQRRIGWHILTKTQDEPARGVPYVQTALLEEPLKGNSWQDLARVYSATLGMHLD